MNRPKLNLACIRFLRRLYRRYALLCVTVLFLLSVGVPVAVARSQIAPNSTPNPTVSSSPLHRARQLYQQADFQAAEILLEQAVRTFAAQGDLLNQAIALSNLSLIDQKQAQWQQAQQHIDRSIALLQSIDVNPLLLAQSLDIRAQLQLSVGRADIALENWQTAFQIYVEGDRPKQFLANQINQVQAMQNLGLYPRACQTLLTALNIRQDSGGDRDARSISQALDCALQPGELDRIKHQVETQIQAAPTASELELQIRGLRSLGNILQRVGTLDSEERNGVNIDGALELLEWLSITLDRNNIFPTEQTAVLLNLADTERALARRAEVRRRDVSRYVESAESHYQQVLEGETHSQQLRARVNYLILLAEFKPEFTEKMTVQWQQLQAEFRSLPATQAGIYTQLHLIREYFRTTQRRDETTNPYRFITVAEMEEILDRTQHQAEAIQSDRAKAYVLGYRGRLLEARRQWQDAERLTQQAIALATRETANDVSPEITYRLFWQLGRIDKAQNQEERAISAYLKGFDLLQSIRRDLIATSTENQFNFRDRVAPFYRQMVDILLTTQAESDVNRLNQAREAIEALQLAELDDYFQDACSEIVPTNLDSVIDELEEGTAAIYSILLDNRLESILKIPNHPLQRYQITFEDVRAELEKIDKLQKLLLEPGQSSQIFAISQEIYEWLIAPIESTLQQNNIDTLVFVLDGQLRNIAVSVLADKNNKYLIEKYAIALNPGLRLLPPSPLTDPDPELQAITGGIEDAPSFQARNLPSIQTAEQQLEKVREQIPVVEELFGENLTQQNLTLNIENLDFSVLHLATHGQFSSDPSDTFIMLYDRPVNPDELGALLRRVERQKQQTLELMVLSVCQTAQGDDRAILGLAGIAVRSGAKSTLATLWNANEVATEKFVNAFYQQLRIPGQTKAKAVQKAQLSLIESSDDPYLWATFILVGSWI